MGKKSNEISRLNKIEINMHLTVTKELINTGIQ